MMPLITKSRALESSAVLLLARIVGSDGAAVTQSNIDVINLKVFSMNSDGTGDIVVPFDATYP